MTPDNRFKPIRTTYKRLKNRFEEHKERRKQKKVESELKKVNEVQALRAKLLKIKEDESA